MADAVAIYNRIKNKADGFNEFFSHDKAVILAACIIAEALANSVNGE